MPSNINESVAKHISYSRMSSLFEYGTSKFDKRVNLNKRTQITSRHRLVKVEELLLPVDGATTKIPQESIQTGGETPVVTQESDLLVSGYCDGYEQITDIPLILMGDHTCVFKWIDFHFVRGADNTQLLKFDDMRILPKYAYYFLRNTKLPNHDKYERHFKYVKSLKIPLPSLDVQRQIVAEFETVEQEIGSVKKGIEEAQQGIKAKFLELFGDPVSNPMGWQAEKLAEVTTKIGSGATPKGGESSYVASGTSLIRSMNVYNGCFKYDGLAFITDEQAKQLDGVTVEKNDVLLNITGASVARTCVVPNDVLPARVNQHVSIIRCDSSRLNHVFANAALTTESYQRLLISIGEAAGMSRQAITKAQIENLSMILPPIEQQNSFAEFFYSATESVAKLQLVLDETSKKQSKILEKYL